jgi:ABC-2 type transport system permease protein
VTVPWRVLFNLRIYGKLQLHHLRSHLEYEADFWVGIVGMVLTQGAGFVFIWALFTRLPEVQGWTLADVAFLYGLSIIPRGLADVFCDGVWRLHFIVNIGDLDRILVRPVSPVLQVLTQSASVHGFGTVILGGVIVGRAGSEAAIAWDAPRVVLFALSVVAGVVMIGSINLATNTLAFWGQGANTAFPFLVVNLSEFAKFPLSIYDRAIQIFLTWVLPFGFIAYYPGAVLLGKTDVPAWAGYVTPVVGLLAAAIASLIWAQALRRYQGTGQ